MKWRLVTVLLSITSPSWVRWKVQFSFGKQLFRQPHPPHEILKPRLIVEVSEDWQCVQVRHVGVFLLKTPLQPVESKAVFSRHRIQVCDLPG